MISLDDFLVTTILCMYMYVYKNIYYTPYISRHNILQDGHPRIFSSFFFGVIIPYPVTFGVANQRNSPQGPQGPFRKSPGSSSSGPCTWFTCRSKCRRHTNRSALVPGPGWAMSKVGSGKFEDEENGTKGGKEPRFFWLWENLNNGKDWNSASRKTSNSAGKNNRDNLGNVNLYRLFSCLKDSVRQSSGTCTSRLKKTSRELTRTDRST